MYAEMSGFMASDISDDISDARCIHQADAHIETPIRSPWGY